MFIHLPTDYDFFCVTLAELSSCDRDCIVQKAKNIFYLHRKSLLTLEQEDHTGVLWPRLEGSMHHFRPHPIGQNSMTWPQLQRKLGNVVFLCDEENEADFGGRVVMSPPPSIL